MIVAGHRSAGARAAVLSPRDQFLASLRAAAGDIRALWVPKAADLLTSVDESVQKRTVTHSASLSGRLTAQGSGVVATMDGTSHDSVIADTDALSFGNSTVDQAFSIVVLANITDTAAERVLFSKYNTGGVGGEYYFTVTSADLLDLLLRDQSAAVVAQRISDAAITMGALHLYAATYSAATGGATAGNDVLLYQDGVLIASTASNNAGYVAMENLTVQAEIGSRNANATSWLGGTAALVMVCAGVLSADRLLRIKRACNTFYGLSL